MRGVEVMELRHDLAGRVDSSDVDANSQAAALSVS